MRTLTFLLLFALIAVPLCKVNAQENTYPSVGTGTGNVGVGSRNIITTGPEDLVHIHGWPGGSGKYPQPALRISYGSDDSHDEHYGTLSLDPSAIHSSFSTLGDFVLSSSSTANNLIVTNRSTGKIIFGTCTSSNSDFPRMLITSAGNVGIGTVTPTSVLHTVAPAGNDVSTAMTTDYTGNLLTNIATSSTSGKNKIGVDIASTGTWNGSGSTNTGLHVNATGGATNYSAIFEGGNVGIGVTTPTSLLHTVATGAKTADYTGNLLTNTATSSTASKKKIGLDVASTGTWNGTSATNIGLHVNATGGTNNYSALFDGGNVGINTSTPVFKLDANGDVRGVGDIQVSNTAANGMDLVLDNHSTQWKFLGYNMKQTNDSTLTRIATSSTEACRITMSGDDNTPKNGQIQLEAYPHDSASSFTRGMYMKFNTSQLVLFADQSSTDPWHNMFYVNRPSLTDTNDMGRFVMHTRLFINTDGLPDSDDTYYMMAVKGNIKVQEVLVSLDNWSDFVFDKKYQLMPLSGLESYLSKEHHLPDIPTAAAVQQKGINLGQMDAKLLQKIEELTLYTIECNKKIEALTARVHELESK